MVTPTGSRLGRLTPESLSVISPDGKLLSGPKPTKEVPLHQALQYTSGHGQVRRRTRIAATRRLYRFYRATTSRIGCRILPYGIMQLRKVRLIPYFIPGSSEIGRTIEGLAGKHAAVMLASWPSHFRKP